MSTSIHDNISKKLVVSLIFLANLISGAFAGASTDLILFPLDTLKTRLQAHKSSLKIKTTSSLFKGLAPALAGSIPSSAIYWCTYEMSKTVFGSQSVPEYLLPFVHLSSVAVADICTCLVRNPFEVLKNNVQVGTYKNTRLAMSGIWKNRGISGFLTGYKTLIMREIPFDGIEFVLYEYLKRKLTQYTGHSLSIYHNMLLGSFSGAVASFCTTPLDVVKTRSMLTVVNTHKHSSSYISLFTSIIREEGWRTLFSGCGARVLWISLGGAVYFGSFEEFKRQIMKIS
ncbi:hypothetical protein WA158_004932 [Blastocystis sp. Blastoise]